MKINFVPLVFIQSRCIGRWGCTLASFWAVRVQKLDTGAPEWRPLDAGTCPSGSRWVLLVWRLVCGACEGSLAASKKTPCQLGGFHAGGA